MQIVDIVTEAFERLGYFGEDVSGDMLTSATRSLNFMLLDWCADKSKQWSIDTIPQFLQSGVQTIISSNGTYDILNATVRENGTDIPLNSLSREEWDLLGNKTTYGKPSQYFVDRSSTPPLVYLWPIPNYTGLELHYTRVKYPTDFSNAAKLSDITPHWSNAMAAGLASYLALKFKPDMKKLLDQDAILAYKKASRADSSSTDFIARPLRRWWG